MAQHAKNPAVSYEVIIDADGRLRFVYADELVGLLGLGHAEVSRASHVEPEALADEQSGWSADLSPVGGPRLGPFLLRADALAAELDWLGKSFLTGATCGRCDDLAVIRARAHDVCEEFIEKGESDA